MPPETDNHVYALDRYNCPVTNTLALAHEAEYSDKAQGAATGCYILWLGQPGKHEHEKQELWNTNKSKSKKRQQTSGTQVVAHVQRMETSAVMVIMRNATINRKPNR